MLHIYMYRSDLRLKEDLYLLFAYIRMVAVVPTGIKCLE